MSDFPDGQSKTLLIGFIKRVKTLADQIGELQADVSDVVKEAKGAGFDGTKIREVVSWLRKIDKHGRPAMDEGEAIYDLYRSVIDGGAIKLDEMMDSARDRALLKIFAGDDQQEAQLNKRAKSSRNALALARAAKQARSA